MDWYDAYDPTKDCYKRVQKEFEGDKDDDTLFLAFITNKHPSIRTVNISPCLVDHIDYLIGGSVLFDRKTKIHRACYLSEKDKILVDNLTKKINNRGLDCARLLFVCIIYNIYFIMSKKSILIILHLRLFVKLILCLLNFLLYLLPLE